MECRRVLFRSPVANDIQAIEGGNDRGVRRSYGLRPNEILIDPRQPVATQSRNFRAHNWLKTDVAGAADQGCAQAYLEVLDGGLTLAQRGKDRKGVVWGTNVSVSVELGGL